MHILIFAHNSTLCVIFWEKCVQRRPNVNTATVVFTKVDVERISLIFFASRGGQKGAVFYIYYERITGHRSKWKFFAEGGFILPLYFSVYYEGIWRLSLKISLAKQRRRRKIARRKKYFVWDGYKRPRFFSIYYEGICRTPLKAPPLIMNKM